MHTENSTDDPMGLAAAYNSLAASNSYSLSKPPNNSLTSLASHAAFPSTDASGPDFSFDTLQSPFLGSRQPAHLPTPQSPYDMSQYALNLQRPAPYSHHYFPQPSAPKSRLHPTDEDRFVHLDALQTTTPDPSPFVPRIPLPPFISSSRPTTPARSPPPIHHSDVNLATPTPTRPVRVLDMSPGSTGSIDPSIHSTLSSPFMAKASPAKSKTPSASPIPPDLQRMFGAHQSLTGPGGEIERIRVRMLQEQLQAQKDAESRRPDYLKRHKRAETDLASSEFPELDDDAGDLPGVGITESPVKGRRLKLFQETSEESFEESLMAGGYGLYRTADWQRPSFVPEAIPPSTSGSPIAESPQEASVPTEKEQRKRRRLEAFKKSGPTVSGAKLVPIELEGMGRVIFDINTTVEESVEPPLPEPTPKKRASRRKKKGGDGGPESPMKGKATLPSEPKSAQPNWPDEEFPWKVRRDERTELHKAEEEERLRCIERFLDRDTDDEEDIEDEHVWSPIPESSTEKAPRLARSHRNMKFRGHARLWSQNNRADARAALLSKRAIRELQLRCHRGGNNDGILSCLCGEPDENREMVQCDGCKRWFHLDCIGIMNVSELGPEEEPWFCEECVLLSTPPTVELPLSEPTFVPTDTDSGELAGTEDVPFFHVTEESPSGTSTSTAARRWRAPTTPVRGGSSSFGSATSTRSSWVHSSRNGPVTPRQAQSAHAVRVWQHTPSHGDEEDFDPSSTPSRGIKVQPFHTPKGGNLWSMRWANAPQTPSKRMPTRRHMARYEELSSGNSVPGVSYETLVSAYDESPIRRVTRASETGLTEGRRLFLPEVQEEGFGKRRPEGSLSLLTSDLRRSDRCS